MAHYHCPTCEESWLDWDACPVLHCRVVRQRPDLVAAGYWPVAETGIPATGLLAQLGVLAQRHQISFDSEGRGPPASVFLWLPRWVSALFYSPRWREYERWTQERVRALRTLVKDERLRARWLALLTVSEEEQALWLTEQFGEAGARKERGEGA